MRYDAYEGAGGRQSASVALLDSNRSGVVLSAIQGRDYARVYVKELDQGKAVDRALARGAGGRRARDGVLASLDRLRLRATLDTWQIAHGWVDAAGYSSGLVQQVLVLNASYEPLNVCSVRRAHVLVHKQKAELVEVLDRPLRSAEASVRLAARRSARDVRARAARCPAPHLPARALRS